MKKILTIILDGFGYREETEGNAIKAANMANFNAPFFFTFTSSYYNNLVSFFLVFLYSFLILAGYNHHVI